MNLFTQKDLDSQLGLYLFDKGFFRGLDLFDQGFFRLWEPKLDVIEEPRLDSVKEAELEVVRESALDVDDKPVLESVQNSE